MLVIPVQPGIQMVSLYLPHASALHNIDHHTVFPLLFGADALYAPIQLFLKLIYQYRVEDIQELCHNKIKTENSH